MVLTIQPFVALHRIFQLELNFGKRWRESQRYFVNKFTRYCEVGPPRKELVLFVLQFELTTLVEFAHHVLNLGWMRLVRDVL